MGPTPTRTLGMRLSSNFVNMYTIAYRVQCVQYTFTFNGQPGEDPGEEKCASVESADKSARIDVHVGVAVGVGVGPMEFKLYQARS